MTQTVDALLLDAAASLPNPDIVQVVAVPTLDASATLYLPLVGNVDVPALDASPTLPQPSVTNEVVIANSAVLTFGWGP